MNKALLISLLLLQSCASGLKTYKVIYTEVGVKCAQDYYYSFRYDKCVYIPPTYSPSGISSPIEYSFKPTPDRETSLNQPIKRKIKAIVKTKPKIDCKAVLTNINKCSL